MQQKLHACASACTCCDTIVDSWQLSCEKGVHVIGWEDIKWTESSSPHEHHFCRENAHYRPVCSALFTVYGKLLENPAAGGLCWEPQLHDMSLCYQGVKIKTALVGRNAGSRPKLLPMLGFSLREVLLETTSMHKAVRLERFIHSSLLTREAYTVFASWPPLIFLAYLFLSGPGRLTTNISFLLVLPGRQPNGGVWWRHWVSVWQPSPFRIITYLLMFIFCLITQKAYQQSLQINN